MAPHHPAKAQKWLHEGGMHLGWDVLGAVPARRRQQEDRRKGQMECEWMVRVYTGEEWGRKKSKKG